MTQQNNFLNFTITSGTPVSDAFLALGITNFLAASEYVRALAYGRNSNKSNRLLVLSEKRGTCSGKHALLAELAEENRQPFELYFGFFKISKDTHKAVAPILERNGLSYYPELHAYLVLDGRRFDFTGDQNPIEPQFEFLKEFPVKPDQVENYKELAHRQFLKEWLATERLSHRLSLDEFWKIREECIAARSGS